jgi:hypothetical protein
LLFDGLDEVNVADNKRIGLINDVHDFTRKYDKCQRLITCRLAANEFIFQDYLYVEMVDFDEAQVREFVIKWFEGTADRRERGELFLSELNEPESERLRELARVPLLLTLLCLAFEETLKLSQRRVELYEEALNALLRKWDASRNIRRDEVYHALTVRRKGQMLAQVADETFGRAENFISRKTLVRNFEAFVSRLPDAPESVDGDAILNAIIAHHGLFLERARDIFSFAHLTFQEYFAARYIVENETRMLPRLLDHFYDPRYHEVFILTVAQLADATEFFELFLDRLTTEVLEYSGIVSLLRQVMKKASNTPETGTRVVSARSLYLYFALDRHHALNRDDRDHTGDIRLNRDYFLNRIVDLSRDLAHKLDLDHALELHRIFDRNLDYALARARNRDLDLDRDRALILANSYAHDLAHAPSFNQRLVLYAMIMYSILCIAVVKAIPNRKEKLEWIKAASEFAVAAANQSGWMDDLDETRRLLSLIEDLERSSPIFDPLELDRISSELSSIGKIQGLIFPHLREGDYEALVRYLGGNLLLLECLNHAVVADREAIKDRLFLIAETEETDRLWPEEHE